MKEQKVWDLFALLAVGLLVLGVFWVNNTGNVIGKILIILGVTSFVVSIVGGNRSYKKHRYQCPDCGAVIKPVGRWLPGVGFNGTNTVTCTCCNATFHIQDLLEK